VIDLKRCEHAGRMRIIHSPSGVALAPRMPIAGMTSVSLLNVKAIGADTGNSLGLNLSACFALAIFPLLRWASLRPRRVVPNLTRGTALVRCLRPLYALLGDMLSPAETASLLAHAFWANVPILLA
jgi:hypothetical protein